MIPAISYNESLQGSHEINTMTWNHKEQSMLDAILRATLPADSEAIYDWEDIDRERLDRRLSMYDKTSLRKALKYLRHRAVFRYARTPVPFEKLPAEEAEKVLQQIKAKNGSRHTAMVRNLVDEINRVFLTEPKIQKRIYPVSTQEDNASSPL